MLCELVVDGLGVIDRAELGLEGGLTALTGETGAGKTLIVAALGLLLGDRADRSLIRSGSGRALVEGRFVVDRNHAVAAQLSDAGLADEAGELAISREVFSDDRPARARINGRIATVGLLGEIGSSLVDVAGQHEHHRLGHGAARRALLDAFAGEQAQGLATEVRSSVREAAEAETRLKELREGLSNRERELDILRFEVDAIASVDLKPGEIEDLKRRASVRERAEALLEGIDRASVKLVEEGRAHDLIQGAIADLEPGRDADDRVGDLIDRLRDAALEISDVGAELARLAPFEDEGSLDEIRTRLDDISKLVRKYGSDPEAPTEEASIFGYKERAERRIVELEAVDLKIDEARDDAEAALAKAEEKARLLSSLRQQAAPTLDAAIEEMLARLAMTGARFATQVEPRELYEGGFESIDFLVAANPGDEPRPISRVASGGELSRIALALHVATSTSNASTVVFDEVDAGVGGRAAQSVGRALLDLARSTGAQVIVVTHLPQVAAFADSHHRVTKTAVGATVERVDGGGRVEELSRMLAGLPESERAREHAEELLVMAAEAARS
ncbi:MAG: DNA repair protein RecN [Actinomycetota bacterium]